jgi:hypothetical protein
MFVKKLSGMVISIAAAKIGLEGGTAAPQHLTSEELPTAA